MNILFDMILNLYLEIEISLNKLLILNEMYKIILFKK